MNLWLGFNRRKRPGMALGLILLLLLVGAVFVSVSLYFVTNYFGTSMAMNRQARLYNAAQNGIEWGMAQLWNNKDILSTTQVEYDAGEKLESLRVRDKDGNIIAEGTNPPSVDSRISVTVRLYDCNYAVPEGTAVSGVALPPLRPGDASGGGPTLPVIPPGTSVIIDPSRLLPLGGGMSSHSFVIRSLARDASGITLELETMVVMSK